MALISCRECGQSVSTEAVACPHCGAPQQRPVPPPLPAPPAEQTLYCDNLVVVTSVRVMIGSASYPLRNITSVKMTFTPPQVAGALLVLLGGVFILLLTTIPFDERNYDPIPGVAMGGSIIFASIVWMCSLKTKYHVDLSTSSGELHLLTSKNKPYIEKVAASINDAIVKYQHI
jgi:hypothetical protein